MRRPTLSAALFIVIASPLVGGYAARESWIAVAGRATGFGGRGFYTTVHLTDLSGKTNDVTISFFPSAQPHAVPRSISLRLAPNQNAAVEVGPELTGDAGAIGALRIRSSALLFADARVYSRGAGQPPGTAVGLLINAIPSQFAIGTGESTIVHVPAGTRFKLYAVETHGFPLYFSVRTDHAERRLYLSPNEQRSWDLDALFPGSQAPALRLTGINGSGKIIAVGTTNETISGDFDTSEMSLPSEPRHRMPWPETTAYASAGFALALAAIYRMKK